MSDEDDDRMYILEWDFRAVIYIVHVDMPKRKRITKQVLMFIIPSSHSLRSLYYIGIACA